MKLLRHIFLATVLLIAAGSLSAQEAKDNTFGGWEFVEISHGFGSGPWFASFYYEHDNYQYSRLECWYTRTTVGLGILTWLKADAAYDYMKEPSIVTHRAVFDLTGTLKEGPLKVSVRERYLHKWSEGNQGNELRSRLKVQYAIPGTRLSPYLAAEVFTWGDKWKKTRHYVACTYDFSDKVQLEAFYLYYAFNGLPAEHVLGIGLNLDI